MVQRLHVGMVVGTLGVRRRVPGCEQQRVARPEKQVELATRCHGSPRKINGAAPPDRDAEMLSGFYVVTYLGTGIPVIGVGFLANALGLLRAVEIFSAAHDRIQVTITSSVIIAATMAP